MAKVKIALDATGRGKLSLDGREIQDSVAGLEFSAAPGELNRLMLVLNVDEIEIEADAALEVEFDDPNDAAEAPPVDFLDAIRAVAKR